MNRGPGAFFDQLDATPVSFAVLLGYLTLAVLTDPVSPTTQQLVEHGAAAGALVQDGEPWRLLTHAFLHGGLIHLLLNTLAMFWLGPPLEERLGSLRFALLYVITALAGGVTAIMFMNPLGTLVGGSGALFGMMGASLATLMRQGRSHLEFLDYQGPRRLLGLVAINLALGLFIPYVSNAAHIGGLVAGFVLTFMFLDRGRIGADRISRAAQLGWLLLLAAMTLYTTRPVLRWDYQQRMYFEARTPEDRIVWLRALDTIHAVRDDWLAERWGPRGRDIIDRWLHHD